MNLIDNELNKKKEQSTKIIKIIIACIAILILIGIGLLSYSSYLQSKQFKFIVDKKTIQNYSSELFYFEDDGEIYVSIKDLVNVLKQNSVKIEYNNGGYKDYTEDTTKCHIVGSDEVAGFEINSNKMYKVIKTDEVYEYYTLNEPTKSINGKIYASKEAIEIGFNVQFTYDKKSNSVWIWTLDKIVENYEKQLSKEGISSKTISFSNKKALKYGMMIVKNADEEYGVKNINTNEIILGTKYSDLKFVESTKDFIVTTPEKKQGIMSVSNGKSIEPQYTSIQQLDTELDLYLVSNDKGKYGVYNREKQSTIIYPEYDAIGVDKQAFEIENPYILYDYCIPCKKIENGIEKWELLNINGDKITQVSYDALGYIKGTSKDAKGNNVLIIPEIEGIVIYKDGMYGIINSTGKLLIKVELQQVYSETSGGKTSYYMVYNGQTINILELLEKANSSNKESENNTNSSSDKEAQGNTTSNTTNTTSNNLTTNNATSTTSNNVANNTTNNNTLPSTKNVTNNEN